MYVRIVVVVCVHTHFFKGMDNSFSYTNIILMLPKIELVF